MLTRIKEFPVNLWNTRVGDFKLGDFVVSFVIASGILAVPLGGLFFLDNAGFIGGIRTTSVREVSGHVMTIEEARQFNVPAAIVGFGGGATVLASKGSSGLVPGLAIGLIAGSATGRQYCIIPALIDGDVVTFRQPASVCDDLKPGDTIKALEKCTVRTNKKTGKIISTVVVSYEFLGKE